MQPALTGAELEQFLAIAVPVSIALILWWLGRVVIGARPAEPEVSLPPLCEGCGYNLTHQPLDRRCPECGFSVDLSLTPGMNRRAIPWERWPSPQSWLAAAVAVLQAPRVFYAHACLRTSDAAAARFAVCNYVLIGLGAAAAAGLTMLATQPALLNHVSAEQLLLLLASFGLSFTLGCWLGHRIIAAAVVSWWLARAALPDGRWAARVIAYESTFLWAFCVFWGLLAWSFVVAEDWISKAIGGRFFRSVGLPAEVCVVLGGTVLLGLLWLRRYLIAYRAIRWSNF